MNTNLLILTGTGCTCFFFVIVLAALGYFLVIKKKDAPGIAQSGLAPALEPATTQETIPDPTATSSQDISTAATADPKDMLEPEPEPEPADPLTPVDEPGLVAEQVPTPVADPVHTLHIEPARTLELEPKPAAPSEDAPVPDPSEIAGLDGPIIAADTLDEDESESPTIIISRDPEDKEES